MVKLTRRHILRQGTGLFLTLTPVGAALAKPASPAQFLAVRILAGERLHTRYP